MTKEQQEIIENIKTYIHDWVSESVDEDGYERYAIDEWDKEFINAVETVLSMLKEKDNIINKVEKETREHIGFENRLKRENREPDSFNQGRFYVANNINNILKGG